MSAGDPTVEGLALAVGARPPVRGGSATFRGASLDSRKVERGNAFFAVRGARTDGHMFLRQARTRGAAVAVVERRVAAPAGLPLVRVASSVAALQRGAAWHRSRHHLPVVAVTGSNGKTSTKDLLAHLLAAIGPVTATRGNFNNMLGVPLTLFGISGDSCLAVVEMAMNRPGEIRALARMARPTVGVVLNASLAHAWKFPGVRAVAREKTDLIRELPEGGWAALNADDPAVWGFRGDTRARVIGFGAGRGEIRAAKVRLDPAGRVRFLLHTPSGSAPVRTGLFGLHNVNNALAASAVAWVMGLDPRDIARRLASFRPTAGLRMELRRLKGALAVVDCYNANPGSMRASLEFIRSTRARHRVLVLGEMRELGAHSRAEHAEAGRLAGSLKPRLVVGVGGGARPLVGAAVSAGARDALWVRAPEEAASEVAAALGPGTIALFKGSRAVGLERLVGMLGGGAHRAV